MKALLALALLLTLSSSACAQQPNVVVIILDDASTELMLQTPEIAALADQGMRFSATASSPLCAPTRASVLTGRFMHNTRVTGNLNGEKGYSKLRGNVLPDWFRAAGYASIKSGKWINGVGRDHTGWDNWLEVKTDLPSGVYWLDDLAQRTAAVVNSITNKPIFLYFAPDHHWRDPADSNAGAHESSPLPTSPNFNEKDVTDKQHGPELLPSLTPTDIENITHDWQTTLDAMMSVTKAIKTVMAAFDGKPTIFVITSDSGKFHGEHRIVTGKGKHYDEVIQVPLIFIGPTVPVGVVSTALTYVMDLNPTIAEMAGVSVPPDLDAHSLVPLITNPATPWRKRVLLEYHGYVGVRTDTRKFVEWGNGDCEWYNLKVDPYELQNRCGNGEKGGEFQDYIDAMSTCRGTACWTEENAP